MLESEAKWDQHQVLTMIGYNPPKSTLNVRQKNLVKYTNSRWILGCMSMVFFIIWCLITKSHQKKTLKKFGSKLSLKPKRASQIRKKNFTAILFFLLRKCSRKPRSLFSPLTLQHIKMRPLTTKSDYKLVPRLLCRKNEEPEHDFACFLVVVTTWTYQPALLCKP